MYATNLSNLGLKYLTDLQLNDLISLRDELDQLWKNGQSKISNTLYDKIVDSINYECVELNHDPYEYGVKKTDQQLKTLVDYLTQLHSQGRAIVENSAWDTLNRELTLRNVMQIDPTIFLNESLVQCITLSSTTQEYQDIGNFFSKSLQKSSVIIYSIIRIQNRRLWYIYQQLQKQIPQNNSQRLFHGTASPTHQKLIKYHGFAHSYCPGGLIGDGVYFAVNANYSDNNPYVLKRTNHRRELFVCQVLLGNSSQGQYGCKAPAQGYHSVNRINGQGNDMFCIFNNYQAYPEYIVQYDYE